jgi:hypothetical protein
MRVNGNTIPASVEIYLRGKNAEVRLRENPRKVDYELYEYDEYTLSVPASPGLEQEISANLSEWLKTARSTEVNPAASTVRAMEEDHLAEMGALIEEIYSEDVDMIDGI